MSKKRKPIWLRILLSIISAIISLAVIVAGLCIFVKVKYNINIFDVISQVKMVAQEVNAEDKFKNMFTSSDMESAQTIVNSSIENLITYSEEEGYKISSSISGTMTNDIKLSGKQVGAVINMLAKNSGEMSFEIAGAKFPFTLIQIEFANLEENSVEFNSVVKLDISSIKEKMNFFPANWIAGYIPNNIYISSTITIHKGENVFAYTIESKSLTINNLDEQGTESLLKTINTFVKFGTVADLNNSLGGAFANAMIGNADVNGFAYSLKDVGATDYNFEKQSEEILFVIKK